MFLIFVVIALSQPVGGLAYAADEELGLNVAEALFDFGDYYANQAQTHTFTIINNTGKTVKIGKVHTGCGCMATDLSKKTMSAGESTEITVKVRANSIVGYYSKNIYVETDSPSKRWVQFSISGNAKPILNISPQPLQYVGTLEAGKSYSYDFVMKPLVPELKLAVDSERLPDWASAQLSYDKEKSVWNLKVGLCPQTPKTQFRLMLQIIISQPENWPDVDFLIYGMVKSAL